MTNLTKIAEAISCQVKQPVEDILELMISKDRCLNNAKVIYDSITDFRKGSRRPFPYSEEEILMFLEHGLLGLHHVTNNHDDRAARGDRPLVRRVYSNCRCDDDFEGDVLTGRINVEAMLADRGVRTRGRRGFHETLDDDYSRRSHGERRRERSIRDESHRERSARYQKYGKMDREIKSRIIDVLESCELDSKNCIKDLFDFDYEGFNVVMDILINRIDDPDYKEQVVTIYDAIHDDVIVGITASTAIIAIMLTYPDNDTKKLAILIELIGLAVSIRQPYDNVDRFVMDTFDRIFTDNVLKAMRADSRSNVSLVSNAPCFRALYSETDRVITNASFSASYARDIWDDLFHPSDDVNCDDRRRSPRDSKDSLSDLGSDLRLPPIEQLIENLSLPEDDDRQHTVSLFVDVLSDVFPVGINDNYKYNSSSSYIYNIASNFSENPIEFIVENCRSIPTNVRELLINYTTKYGNATDSIHAILIDRNLDDARLIRDIITETNIEDETNAYVSFVRTLENYNSIGLATVAALVGTPIKDVSGLIGCRLHEEQAKFIRGNARVRMDLGGALSITRKAKPYIGIMLDIVGIDYSYKKCCDEHKLDELKGMLLEYILAKYPRLTAADEMQEVANQLDTDYNIEQQLGKRSNWFDVINDMVNNPFSIFSEANVKPAAFAKLLVDNLKTKRVLNRLAKIDVSNLKEVDCIPSGVDEYLSNILGAFDQSKINLLTAIVNECNR